MSGLRLKNETTLFHFPRLQKRSRLGSSPHRITRPGSLISIGMTPASTICTCTWPSARTNFSEPRTNFTRPDTKEAPFRFWENSLEGMYPHGMGTFLGTWNGYIPGSSFHGMGTFLGTLHVKNRVVEDSTSSSKGSDLPSAQGEGVPVHPGPATGSAAGRCATVRLRGIRTGISEASKRVSYLQASEYIFDRGTGSKPERLRSSSLQADLSLIV